MDYQKQKILFGIFLFLTLCLVVFSAVQMTMGQEKDTVKVSLSQLDKEIVQSETELRTLLQNIEQAKQNSVYLQGALDKMKDIRNKLTVKDTVKAETKKKGK